MTIGDKNTTSVTADRLASFIAQFQSDVVVTDGPLDLSKYVQRGEHVGSGAYGEVYKGSFNIPKELEPPSDLPLLAVKVIRAMPLKDPKEQVKRNKTFRREVKVWSSLRHKNVLQLLGFAFTESDQNQPSLIALWMPNGTVKDYLEANPAAPRFEVIFGIGEGLEYLHSYNPQIVHGDIKAVNVLVDEKGLPYICDFGLSRMMEDTSLWATSATHASGTIRWQSPELILGTQPTVTAESDVYAFGMTSYEIMTGKLPFHELLNDGAVTTEVIVNHAKPSRPQRTKTAKDGIPDALWNLWMRCWRHSQNDHLTFVDHDKYMGLRPRIREVLRVMEIIKRSEVLPIVEQDIDKYRSRGLWHSIALSQDRTTFVSFCRSDVTQGQATKLRLPTIIRAWHLPSGTEVAELTQHAAPIVAIAKDGSKIAAIKQPRATWTIYVTDITSDEDAKRDTEIPLPDLRSEKITCLAFSPDGTHLACGMSDGRINLWHIKSLRNLFAISPVRGLTRTVPKHTGQVGSLAFSPDGSLLASTAIDGTVCIWNALTGKRMFSPFPGNDLVNNPVVFSSDGRLFAAGSVCNAVEVWSATTGKPAARPLVGNIHDPNLLAFSTDSQTLISYCLEDGKVKAWSIRSGQPIVPSLDGNDVGSSELIPFTLDGKEVILPSYNSLVRAWFRSESAVV